MLNEMLIGLLALSPTRKEDTDGGINILKNLTES